MSKLGKIIDIKYNYGSKIYPENQVILDNFISSTSVLTFWYWSLILISCSGLKLGKIDRQLGKKVAIFHWEWGRILAGMADKALLVYSFLKIYIIYVGELS